MRHRILGAVITLALSAVTGTASADVMFNSLNDLAFGDAARSLDFLGFDLVGQKNPVTGGIDFIAVQNFQNANVNLGGSDVTLNGPVSFEFHTGNRLLRTVDIGFTTALNANSTAQPLTYAFTNSLGLQDRSLTGSVLVDGDLSINQLGFYDLNLRYSTRNDRTADGPLGSSSDTLDADYGPVHVRGNVFIDLAAVVLDPLYARAGQDNPLAPFSAYAQAGKDASGDPTARAITQGAGRVSTGVHGGGGAVVPLPTTLLLMGCGLPFALRRRAARS